MHKILLLDNYDSFTYNLYQYLRELNAEVEVRRNNAITLAEIIKRQYSHIVISPGPGTPAHKADFGICAEVIKKLGPKTPLLGVCLGHQGIIYVFGGKIIRAPQIMHGKTSLIKHNQQCLFKNITNPLEVMRYHSLIGERKSLPQVLEITAETPDKLIMAVQHKKYPIFGIQFHPESIGTQEGKGILANFLNM